MVIKQLFKTKSDRVFGTEQAYRTSKNNKKQHTLDRCAARRLSDLLQ